MRILVLGAGATGGYFGGRLVEAGSDVTFLVRERRAAQLRDHGLVVHSGLGDIRRSVSVTRSEDIGGPFDLVLLNCKAYDLASAVQAIRPAIGPHTLILPLLNGLAHLDVLDHEFGVSRVLGGLCHLSTAMDKDGEIRHLNLLNLLVLGPRSPGQEGCCKALGEILSTTPVVARISQGILQDMWEKFVFLSTAAAMTASMRAAIGNIIAADDGRALVLECLDECRSVAASYGHPQSLEHYSETSRLLTEPGSQFKASMLRDIEKGAQTEADHIIGHMLQLGRARGLPMPVLRMAYCHLQAYHNRRSRDASPGAHV